ncbi:MAG: Oligoendopeptidase F, plasmid [Chlamydiae bacterium]|nr:Oligoendopeptidase F, plasmid [Chlamydiota bacterium]
MTVTTLPERDQVKESDKWNVEDLFPNLEAWEVELQAACNPKEKIHWPELVAYKGKLGEGAQVVKKFFFESSEVERRLSKLFTYAHMRHDEDMAVDGYKGAYHRITALYQDLQEELSWEVPEILALPDEVIAAYLKAEELADWHVHLEEIVRMKPHVLSADKEQLLALSGKALNTSARSFSAFNNADLQFPQVVNTKGEKFDLTHGKYLTYIRDADRTLRKSAFEGIHQSFLKYENTLCELLSGQVQNSLFQTRARQYDSCMEASLFPHQIDTSVYRELIKAVRGRLSSLHRYMKKRKEALKVDELHMWDLHVPLVPAVELSFSYEEAEKLVIDSVAPLGKEYQSALSEGLLKGRWVDRYENARKRSGAYSTGCYDSMPYILMNYSGNFQDLMTLAHEAGHSMHSLHSIRHQPYQYSHYPIFLAEVASTFNEELIFLHLEKQDLTDDQRRFLVNQQIEDIRSTFFRQTMFAEFELKIHELAEQAVPLTPQLLKEIYYQLNVDYFGESLCVDQLIEIEWARIPHFYSHFYVYQYATGISAAHSLFNRVMQEEGRDAYLQFLSSGSSHFPLELLKAVGVDMKSSQPVESLIDHFDQLVDDFFTN